MNTHRTADRNQASIQQFSHAVPAGPTPAPPPVPSELDGIWSRLNYLRQEITANNDRVDQLIERAFGPSAKANGAAGATLRPEGYVRAIGEEISEIATQVNRQIELITTLERLA